MVTESIINPSINFKYDLDEFSNFFLKEIKGKNVLIIGGAGTIGSSYIKEILNYYPAKIVIVDNNENIY